MKKNFVSICTLQPEFLNICFWYIPMGIRQLDVRDRLAKLNKVAPKVKELMMRRGTAMISFEPGTTDKPAFFRQVISNPGVKKTDLEFLLGEIRTLAEQMQL